MFKVYHRYSSRSKWYHCASFSCAYDAYSFALSFSYPFVKVISPGRRVLYNSFSRVISSRVRTYISDHAYYLDERCILSNYRQNLILDTYKTLSL